MTAQRTKEELKDLAENVVRLSHLLTRDREQMPAAYLKDDGLRKAYRAYYLPPNIPKIFTPLRELFRHPKTSLTKSVLRIMDVGTGPGSALLGVLDFFSAREHRPQLELIAVDQVAENLKLAEELILSCREQYDPTVTLRLLRENIEGMAPMAKADLDLIILSNVLNELFPHDEDRIGKRVEFVDRILCRSLAADGSCIIIEPALRETSRSLLQVRDGMRERGFHIYSPCLIRNTCPALSNPKDWCHEDMFWDPPELVKDLDALTGLRKDSLKFSYLVLRKDDLSLSDVAGTNAFRVVSEPLITKGKREYYLCGSGNRRLVTRLDKDITPANETFSALKRGDIVTFDGLVDEGKRYKVGKGTGVVI